jgi:hypothetical protein
MGVTYMRKIRLIAATMAFIATATAATGSSGGPTVPKFITYLSSGLVYVYLPIAGVTNIPACGQGNVGSTYDYVFDSTTAAGKSMLAGVIAAHAAGEGLWFYGSGDCGVLAGTETLVHITTEN